MLCFSLCFFDKFRNFHNILSLIERRQTSLLYAFLRKNAIKKHPSGLCLYYFIADTMSIDYDAPRSAARASKNAKVILPTNPGIIKERYGKRTKDKVIIRRSAGNGENPV